MSPIPDSEQSSVQKPLAAFPFKPSTPGPETVVNPERCRGPAPTRSKPDASESSIWHRLFPADAHSAGQKPPEGVAQIQLGHFIIERQIGIGGMGAVFRAIDERLQRVVALKVLSPAQLGDAASVQRFQNEAQAAAQLDHDNIARVFYIGEDRGVYFIAFEYVTGTNVRDLIRDDGPLDPAEAVNYVLQIATALVHTSAASVVHRDIKPSNIIVTPKGRAKLVDLGLARKESDQELTLAGTTLGTFDYISPEQAKDPRNVDVRSDIYSLGCTLYHMLTGEPPYPEGTVAQKLLGHQGDDPPDPAQKNHKVSSHLSAVVKKMMASDLRRRYSTPDDMIHDLMLIARSMGLRGVNPEGLIWKSSKFERPRFWERHLGWMATAAVLLLIVGLLELIPGIGLEVVGLGSRKSVAQRDARPDSIRSEKLAANGAHRPGDAEISPESNASASRHTTPAADSGHPVGKAVEPVDDDGSQKPQISAKGATGGTAGNSRPLSQRAPGFGDNSLQTPPLPEPSIFPKVIRPSNSSTEFERSSENLKPVVEVAEQPVEAPKPQADLATPDVGGLNSPQVDPFLQMPAISIIGDIPQSFPTLEAACRAAQDGDIIELSYNGRRPAGVEKPIRVTNKTITIRSGKDRGGNLYRPVLEFDTGENPAEGETRMITLIDSSLNLIHLDLRLTVRQDVIADQWVFFSLQGAERVVLKATRISLQNPGDQTAAIFELISAPGHMEMEMTNNGQTGAQQKSEIKIVESFLRGGCDLFVTKHTQPGSFEIENSVVALEGTLLNVIGDRDMPKRNAIIELELDHVTGLLGNGLLKMSSGDEPRFMIPVHVSVFNNILATNSSTPLISMSGNTNTQDFRNLLRWVGAKNFYDQFEMFWSITPGRVTENMSRFDFKDWKAFWPDTEIDAINDEIAWKNPWNETKELSEITVADLELRHEAAIPKAFEATDDGDVGADLSLFQVPPVDEEQTQTSE